MGHPKDQRRRLRPQGLKPLRLHGHSARLKPCPDEQLFLRVGEHGGLFESFLRGLVGFGGMLHGLLGVLVAGLVIFLAVMRGGDTMRVCGQLVHFGGSLVRVVRHDCPLDCKPTVALCDGDVHDVKKPTLSACGGRRMGQAKDQGLEREPSRIFQD
jgi:hypothetical protein